MYLEQLYVTSIRACLPHAGDPVWQDAVRRAVLAFGNYALAREDMLS